MTDQTPDETERDERDERGADDPDAGTEQDTDTEHDGRTADEHDADTEHDTDHDEQTSDGATDATGETFEGSVTQKAFLFDSDGRTLLTKSDGSWTVPGGRFEYGETMPGGLRRELREELAVETRVGAPVGVSYGAWITGDGTPLVTVFYRARTDETQLTLNEEHDAFEWVDPETARDRLVEGGGELAVRFLARAVTLDRIDRGHDAAVPDTLADCEPFTTRRDPFAGTDTDEWLAYLANAREPSLDELRAKYG